MIRIEMDATDATTPRTTSAITSLFAEATPPRAGSTSWYDACDLLATELKRRLRDRVGRGFHVEVYGDEVGVILRVRGDGYGIDPWSVDATLDASEPLEGPLDELVGRVVERTAGTYHVRAGAAD